MESAEYVLYDWTNWGDWHGPWGIIGGIFIVSFVFIAMMVWLSLLSKKRMFVERGYTLPQYHTDQKYRKDQPNESKPAKNNTKVPETQGNKDQNTTIVGTDDPEKAGSAIYY